MLVEVSGKRIALSDHFAPLIHGDQATCHVGLALITLGQHPLYCIGLPTVRLEANFRAVSRMGDLVTLSLAVERLGTSSLTLLLRCFDAAGQTRMEVRQVLVTTSLESHRAVDVPADLRAAILRSADAASVSSAS